MADEKESPAALEPVVPIPAVGSAHLESGVGPQEKQELT
jgi:hypothetical protein